MTLHNTIRCSICDRTNNQSVQNLPGGFVGTGSLFFYTDPLTKDKVCRKCKSEIELTLKDFTEDEIKPDVSDNDNAMDTLFRD